jgi:DnaJ-class molecular chaperone
MATTARDYYDILGVPRTAGPEDIKKAFRRLARQYHPDLHTGSRKADMERKFKELNEAYEILGDPERRKKYDQYGHQWAQAEAFERARQQAGAQGAADGSAWTETFHTGGSDFGDIFEAIFGGRSRGGDRRRSARFEEDGEDLVTTARLSLRDAVTGVTRRLHLTDEVPCSACQGHGRVQRRPCPACGGTGSKQETRMLDVKIPAGVRDGTRVRIAGKGAYRTIGGRRGNLYLNVQLEPDPVFERQGDDLQVILPIYPWEAALGAEITAPTLGDPIKIKIPAESRSGHKLRIKGKGVPGEGDKRGDLYFVLQVTLPSPLSAEERRAYEQMARTPHPDPRADLLRKAGG